MERNGSWFVYILHCADGTLYTGITTDIERRIREHEGRGGSGAKYLKGRSPLTLAFHHAVPDRSVASKLEYRIKSLSRVEKQLLIKGDLAVQKLLETALPDGAN